MPLNDSTCNPNRVNAGPAALDYWREVAELAMYPTRDRSGGGFTVRSDACHDGGDNAYGVWVTSSAKGYPQAHCHKHPFPESDDNFRRRCGLPEFEVRQTEFSDPKWQRIATYTHGLTGATKDVERRECGPGCAFMDHQGNRCEGDAGKHIRQSRGKIDGYLVRLWALDAGGVIVWGEGEKAARAIGDAGFLGASTIGGKAVIARADWSPVAGRDVLIWPDVDAVGAGMVAAKCALQAGATGVRVVDPSRYAKIKHTADAADLPLDERRAELAYWVEHGHVVTLDNLPADTRGSISNAPEPTADKPQYPRVPAPQHFRPQRIAQEPFPVDCLPEFMQEVVEAASVITRRPAAACATVVLTCCAATFQADYRYTSARYSGQVISLFSIVSAPPGTGKSETNRLFDQPFVHTDQDIVVRHDKARRNWDDMDSQAQRRSLEKQPRPVRPDILCSDATVEALARQITRGRPSMFQVMTEAAQLVGGWSAAAERLTRTLSCYNALWEGERIDVLRMQDGSTYKTPQGRTLSKLLFGQKQTMDWVLDPRAAHGYAARVFLVRDDCAPAYSTNDPVVTATLPDAYQTVRKFNDVLLRELTRQNECIEFSCTPSWEPATVGPDEPTDAYLMDQANIDDQHTSPDLQADESDICAQWQNRRVQHACRVASVIAAFNAACDGDGDLPKPLIFTRADAERALRIVDWFQGELRRCVAMSGYTDATADAQQGWELIRDKMPSGYGNVRQLLGKYSPFSKDTDRRERAIQWLETEGAVEKDPGQRAQWRVMWE